MEQPAVLIMASFSATSQLSEHRWWLLWESITNHSRHYSSDSILWLLPKHSPTTLWTIMGNDFSFISIMVNSCSTPPSAQKGAVASLLVLLGLLSDLILLSLQHEFRIINAVMDRQRRSPSKTWAQQRAWACDYAKNIHSHFRWCGIEMFRRRGGCTHKERMFVYVGTNSK